MAIQRATQHSVESTNIADLLERVLDKGIVVAGDIKISLVDIELLTIQLRLVICSVDKAKEMGMDWWVNNPCFTKEIPRENTTDSLAKMEDRLSKLESSFAAEASKHTSTPSHKFCVLKWQNEISQKYIHFIHLSETGKLEIRILTAVMMLRQHVKLPKSNTELLGQRTSRD